MGCIRILLSALLFLSIGLAHSQHQEDEVAVLPENQSTQYEMCVFYYQAKSETLGTSFFRKKGDKLHVRLVNEEGEDSGKSLKIQEDKFSVLDETGKIISVIHLKPKNDQKKSFGASLSCQEVDSETNVALKVLLSGEDRKIAAFLNALPLNSDSQNKLDDLEVSIHDMNVKRAISQRIQSIIHDATEDTRIDFFSDEKYLRDYGPLNESVFQIISDWNTKSGSAFLVGEDKVLTNRHVIDNIGGPIVLRKFKNGGYEDFGAEVIAEHPLNDIALLQVSKPPSGERIGVSLKFAESPLVGTNKIITVGFPREGPNLKPMEANLKISPANPAEEDLKHRKEDLGYPLEGAIFMQSQAYPGNSGGPLIQYDESGTPLVAGIIYTGTQDNQHASARPTKEIRDWLSDLQLDP